LPPLRSPTDPIASMVRGAIDDAVRNSPPRGGGAGGLTERDLASVPREPSAYRGSEPAPASACATMDSSSAAPSSVAGGVPPLDFASGGRGGAGGVGGAQPRAAWSTAQPRNPLFGGGPEDAEAGHRTQRRMVPSYFDRKEDRPRRKGARPVTDAAAAGSTTEQRGRHADDFKPSHRILAGPASNKESPVHPPRQKREAPASHQHLGTGNPILQRGSDRFEAPGTARPGIRVFPDRTTAEQRTSARPEDQERPASSYARRGPKPADHNPILGTGGAEGVYQGARPTGSERPCSAHGEGVKIFPGRHNMDHDDVISHRFSGQQRSERNTSTNNFKVGDVQRSQTASERLDAVVQAQLESKRTFILNRAKVETSSDALRNFIYDNPSAVP
jgi:hypothetical protein